MASKKKKTAKTKRAASSSGKKAAPKKSARKPAKAAKVSAKAKSSSTKAKAKGGGKTRAQALAEARKKINRKGKTPRLSNRAAAQFPIFQEMYNQVIQAYAAASREMAEWLAAARRSDKTA